jgi:polyisoprenoid-binding protein YceI
MTARTGPWKTRLAPALAPLLLAVAGAGTLHAQSNAAPTAKSAPARSSERTSQKVTKSAAKPAASAAPRAFVVATDGNEARYRVRERLVGVDLDNDAVGVTRAVTGTLFVDAQGRVVRDSSRIVVDVSGLKSDKDRRDGFLRRRTLQTDSFPTVTLVPTAIRGGTGTLPTSGSATFELLGDLTVRGATRPTVWTVTARADGGAVAGTAVTAFTFKDFGLDQPRVPVVLSVADTIKLEYDFRLVPGTLPR